jgi:hypothetical protein
MDGVSECQQGRSDFRSKHTLGYVIEVLQSVFALTMMTLFRKQWCMTCGGKWKGWNFSPN